MGMHVGQHVYLLIFLQTIYIIKNIIKTIIFKKLKCIYLIMKFLKNIIYKNLNVLKYISKQKTKEIKFEKKIKIDSRKEFDVYKYFLVPIEERDNFKW